MFKVVVITLLLVFAMGPGTSYAFPSEAEDDEFVGAEDTSVSGNVLANDSAGTFVDSFTAPAGFDFSLSSNGNMNYTPDEHFSGTVSFSYTIDDTTSFFCSGLFRSDALCTDNASASIFIAPVVDLPTLVTTGSLSGDEDVPVDLDIDLTEVDTDGSQSIVIEITGVPEFGVLSAGTPAATGVFELSPAELTNLQFLAGPMKMGPSCLAYRLW